MSEATTDSVKAIVRNVHNGVRRVTELSKCGCGDCRSALAILQEEKAKATEKELEDAEHVCQCWGTRPGERIGPSCSKRYLCGPCMIDPSPTFEGCKHGD